MPQPFIGGLSISRAPLQASTSSSCATSGKPSRTRNSSSFHEPRRILAKPDMHVFAVLLGNTVQVPFDVARVGSRPYHIQQPIAAAAIAAELDTDRPIRVVELGFFRGREIPIADDVELRRHLVDNGTPLPFEIQPGGGPDLPIAAEQPLARECRQ